MKSDDQLNSEAARAPGLLPALWLCAVVLLQPLAALSQAFPSKPIKVVARRSSQLPEVASLREQGVDMTARSWIGLFGSTGMPEGIARRVNDEIRKSMENADFREKYTTGIGLVYTPATPEEFARFIADERRGFQQLADVIGLKKD